MLILFEAETVFFRLDQKTNEHLTKEISGHKYFFKCNLNVSVPATFSSTSHQRRTKVVFEPIQSIERGWNSLKCCFSLFLKTLVESWRFYFSLSRQKTKKKSIESTSLKKTKFVSVLFVQLFFSPSSFFSETKNHRINFCSTQDSSSTTLMIGFFFRVGRRLRFDDDDDDDEDDDA